MKTTLARTGAAEEWVRGAEKKWKSGVNGSTDVGTTCRNSGHNATRKSVENAKSSNWVCCGWSEFSRIWMGAEKMFIVFWFIAVILSLIYFAMVDYDGSKYTVSRSDLIVRTIDYMTRFNSNRLVSDKMRSKRLTLWEKKTRPLWTKGTKWLKIKREMYPRKVKMMIKEVDKTPALSKFLIFRVRSWGNIDLDVDLNARWFSISIGKPFTWWTRLRRLLKEILPRKWMSEKWLIREFRGNKLFLINSFFYECANSRWNSRNKIIGRGFQSLVLFVGKVEIFVRKRDSSW